MTKLQSFVTVSIENMEKMIAEYLVRAKVRYDIRLEEHRQERIKDMREKTWFGLVKTPFTDRDPSTITDEEIMEYERLHDVWTGIKWYKQTQSDYGAYMVPFKEAIKLSTDGTILLAVQDIYRFGFCEAETFKMP